MVIVLTYMAISSLKTPTQPLVASVSSKFCHFLKKYIYHNFCVLSYTCTYVGTYRDKNLYRWNVSVSDHCCLHCDGVVYKADTVIDTTHHEDECKSSVSTVCRKIPGKLHFLISYFSLIIQDYPMSLFLLSNCIWTIFLAECQPQSKNVFLGFPYLVITLFLQVTKEPLLSLSTIARNAAMMKMVVKFKR